MNKYNLIKYLYQTSAYSIERMCQLVQTGDISEEDFYDITRLQYSVVIKQVEKEARARVQRGFDLE